jgi:hypothetical protein
MASLPGRDVHMGATSVRVSEWYRTPTSAQVGSKVLNIPVLSGQPSYHTCVILESCVSTRLVCLNTYAYQMPGNHGATTEAVSGRDKPRLAVTA